MSFRIVLPKTATPAIITTFSISFELIKDDETEGEWGGSHSFPLSLAAEEADQLSWKLQVG